MDDTVFDDVYVVVCGRCEPLSGECRELRHLARRNFCIMGGSISHPSKAYDGSPDLDLLRASREPQRVSCIIRGQEAIAPEEAR